MAGAYWSRRFWQNHETPCATCHRQVEPDREADSSLALGKVVWRVYKCSDSDIKWANLAHSPATDILFTSNKEMPASMADAKGIWAATSSAKMLGTHVR